LPEGQKMLLAGSAIALLGGAVVLARTRRRKRTILTAPTA
jgi:hypothetical protein